MCPKYAQQLLIVSGGVKFFGPEKLRTLMTPSSFQILDIKKSFESRWNILEEGKHTIIRMFIPENVEDEPFFRKKCVPVNGVPVFHRFEAPMLHC